ncbi:homoserine dehydrogenase [Candidatus Gracilibacteria bacterium]|nr:homoserine dehydrogenase [Candidatus Gracilibacteria bacterium]MCF7896992.1 homoserine dehydrogenase [Candidatus Gracilibacteria bacterium]
MDSIKVGILGFGVVGSGVVKVLQKNFAEITKRVGQKIEIAAIADLDLKSDRGVKVDRKILTTDGFAVCADPKIDIIVELVGGTGVAGKFIETALDNGKHVVTANKALLSEKGAPLFKLAEQKGKLLLFEAAVGGAIPIIRTLKTSLASEKIEKIYGILNGTCNFILTKLANEGGEFSEVLADAQKRGFAEANPTLDIEGGDTAHKIALLASIAFGTQVDFKQIHIEGITKLSAADFEFARRLNRKIKLVAVAKKENGSLEIRVNPTLLSIDSPLAKIDGVTNAVAFHGKNLGEIILSGPGAGSLPTATAVVGDIIEAARGSEIPSRGIPESSLEKFPMKKIEDVESEYYLRFGVKDEAGVIRDISNVLAKHKLNIRDILQLDLNEFQREVPLVILLHKANEAKVRKAVEEINQLKCVNGKAVVLRVEE